MMLGDSETVPSVCGLELYHHFFLQKKMLWICVLSFSLAADLVWGEAIPEHVKNPEGPERMTYNNISVSLMVML